jgi:hypothetical protein
MMRLTATLQRILILVIALALSLPAVAEATGRRDGNFWRGSTAHDKTVYVTGFFDGMTFGGRLSSWSMNLARPDVHAEIKVLASYDAMADYYFGHVTAIQLADGLDKFYEDYRNRNIQIYDAIWLVANSISGKSDAEMQTLIENFRKTANSN